MKNCSVCIYCQAKTLHLEQPMEQCRYYQSSLCKISINCCFQALKATKSTTITALLSMLCSIKMIHTTFVQREGVWYLLGYGGNRMLVK